ISNAPAAAPWRASSDSIVARSPTSADRMLSSFWARRAPATISAGAWSPPMASRAMSKSGSLQLGNDDHRIAGTAEGREVGISIDRGEAQPCVRQKQLHLEAPADAQRDIKRSPADGAISRHPVEDQRVRRRLFRARRR